MQKVMLVDDEVLAIDYLTHLIDWESQGYKIVGSAINGKKALDIYEKHKPDIVISDICMMGMDGLELARQLKAKNSDVVIILISAYKDFEYAQKGIQYGVANYLLKHELNEEILIRELKLVREKLEAGEKRKKIYREYFTNRLIYNQVEEGITELEIGNRFFLVMVHKNLLFSRGMFNETKWETYELQEVKKVIEEEMEEKVYYVSDVQITPNNLIVLYKIQNTTSKYIVSSLIFRKCEKICECLISLSNCQFNVVYSEEINRLEISSIFQKISFQIRYAAFWKPQCAYNLYKLQPAGKEERIAWNVQVEELRTMIYERSESIKDFIGHLFGMTEYYGYSLGAFKELLHAVENLVREIEEKEGIKRKSSREELCKVGEIQHYYIECITDIRDEIYERNGEKYCKLVIDMMRYIYKNYNQEISLESIGEEFQMNGVYLGQLFKKEVGITFLKYLTNYRIGEAKKLLLEGKMNITEVSKQVGYKTSQYFSQIFIKNVGMKPQDYKREPKK
ncbi:hypothetical protein CS063_00415 [Sporanaerobium hydrogeniformans]|uniref:Uncharacterized protein n=1 Tax=Sporanaerobium hydrogeniformans TaxID=3072179 RepID=A0AC61DG04_9FIRM|nr:response regulator [Sporanaerobium hydrogeniformans]PHV71973.1 hypothetical protein CS063_00415 [Sporanaerobium hydrogeniformans]